MSFLVCEEARLGVWRGSFGSFDFSAYLIYVTGPRAKPVEKKSVMWRNFKILYMKHVEKAKICPHVD